MQRRDCNEIVVVVFKLQAIRWCDVIKLSAGFSVVSIKQNRVRNLYLVRCKVKSNVISRLYCNSKDTVCSSNFLCDCKKREKSNDRCSLLYRTH